VEVLETDYYSIYTVGTLYDTIILSFKMASIKCAKLSTRGSGLTNLNW